MYLVWAIFNVALMIFFVALVLTFITKGRTMFQSKYSGLFIVVLTIGVISMLNSGTQKKYDNIYDFNEPKRQLNSSEIIKMKAHLHDDIAFDLLLDIRLRKENKNFTPIYSRSERNGFVSGFEWEYQNTDVIVDYDNEEIRYITRGVLHWKLMNIHVYSEAKKFEGVLKRE